MAVGRLTVERYAFTFYKLELVSETKYFMVCVGLSLVSTGRCRARAGKEQIPSLDQPYAIAHRLSISSVNKTGADLMATIGVAIVERPAFGWWFRYGCGGKEVSLYRKERVKAKLLELRT